MGKVNNGRNFQIRLSVKGACSSTAGCCTEVCPRAVVLILSAVFLFLFLVPGKVRATELSDMVWKVPTGGKILGLAESPVDRTIYVLSEDRMVYALGIAGNILLQSERLEDRLLPFLEAGPDASLYLQTRSGRLIAMNRAGRVVWKVGISGNITGRPVTGPDGVIYYTTSAGILAARTHLGKLMWQYPLEKAGVEFLRDGSLCYGAGKLLWGVDEKGNLLVFNHDGNTLNPVDWFLELPEGTRGVSGRIGFAGPVGRLDHAGASDPVGSVSFLHADAHQLLILTAERVLAFSPAGMGEWVYGLESPVSRFYAGLHSLFIADTSGRLTMVDRHSGDRRWSVTGLPTDAVMLLQAGDGTGPLLVTGRSSSLYLDPWTGKTLGSVRHPEPGAPPILTRSGNPILGGEDWVVYRLRVPEQVGYLSNGERVSRERITWEESASPVKDKDPKQIYTGLLMESLSRESLFDILDDRLSMLARVNSPGDPTEEYGGGSGNGPDGGAPVGYHSNLAVVEELAGTGVLNPVSRAGRLVNDFPELRLRAIRALGEYGTLHSRDLLIEILGYEWNPAVKLEIVRALGSLRSDATGEVMNTLYHFTKNGTLSIDEDPLLADTLIRTVDSLSRYSGLVRESATQLLNEIYFSPLPRNLRLQAMKTLRNFREKK